MPQIKQSGWSPQWATHPGEHLEEYLEVKGWSQAEFARLAGLAPNLVSMIIKRRSPVSAETAVRLERVLGMKAYIWTAIQADWDIWQAHQAESKGNSLPNSSPVQVGACAGSPTDGITRRLTG